MAANHRFAAGDFGGKCERGFPLSQKNNDQPESRRRAPAARKGVPVADAKRRGGSRAGPHANFPHIKNLLQFMAPSGNRFDGVDEGTRTPNHRNHNPVLCR